MIVEMLVKYLSAVPPEIATLILAMMPVVELRGALPVALVWYKLALPEAVGLSFIGNMLPVYPILIFLEYGAKFLRERSVVAERFFNWLFERTRQKLQLKVDKYGVWTLALFVAIPLPVTGAWTGTVAAFIFGLSKPKAMLAIAAGLIISALIVTLITMTASYTVNEWLLPV